MKKPTGFTPPYLSDTYIDREMMRRNGTITRQSGPTCHVHNRQTGAKP